MVLYTTWAYGKLPPWCSRQSDWCGAIDMNRRGKRLLLSNEANWGYGGSWKTHSPACIFVSKMYMVFWLTSKAVADISKCKKQVQIESPKAVSTYISSRSFLRWLASEYSRVTGTQPLPPLWALGYINGGERYHTQSDVTTATDSIQLAKFPLDGVLQ